MTVRDDLTIDWELSPRIVTVAAPSTDISVQDLHDTLTGEFEDSVEGGQYPNLISSAGKENLGSGVEVGITSTLLNTLVAFERRITPQQTGTATSVGTTILVDTAATFVTNGVLQGASLINFTDNSISTVISVTNETTLLHEVLTNGLNNDWTIGDVYSIINEEQCNISGGNLVAEDDVGAEIDPVFPTIGTQVVRTASSSATTQSLATVERAAFGSSITIDPDNLTGLASPGTAYPIGTGGEPSNNVSDTVSIGLAQGIRRMELIGDLDAGSGDTVTGWFIDGISTENHIHLDTGSLFTDCSYHQSHIHGTVYGVTQMHDCEVEDIAGFAGEMHNCTLLISIIVTTGATALILDCQSGIAGTSTSYIDCGGAGADVSIRGFNGGIEIRNVTSGNVSIDLNSGHIIIDSTCTGGTIVCRGTGKLTNNTGGGLVKAEGLSAEDSNIVRIAVEGLNSTHQGYGAMYFVDPTNGQAGNDGRTPSSAVQTFAQAHTLCSDGRNDIIQWLNPSGVGATINEDMVITKNNIHLRATSRDLTFKPGSAGGTILTVDGYSCSVRGLLIDGDKAGGTTANYCMQVNGKFCLMDSIWLKQSVLDCLRINGGDYHVINNGEIEKADRHGVSFFDGDLASGSPREVSITGRGNIYLNAGDGVHIDADVGELGSTTRFIRILEGEISQNTGYGVHAAADVHVLTIGQMVMLHNNTTGNRNILTTSQFHDDSPKLDEIYERLDLDANKPNLYQDDASAITGSDFNLTRTDNLDGTSTVQRS